MLTFYMTPGSCTTGIHILLEEVDELFAVELVNLLEGDNRSDTYLALNPKGTIPMIKLEDGSVLTEFQAIACWLAWQHARLKLIPSDALGAARAIEMMSYAVGTIHLQAFARIFTPEKFAADANDIEAVKKEGRRRVAECFDVVSQLLDRNDGYVCSEFSVADAALFYVEFWADRSDIPLPERVRAHYNLMLTRPKVRQVLMEEGYRL